MHQISGETPLIESLPAVFHRAAVKEFSNYDSVEGEMVSIDYSYIEAIRLDPDGVATGMAKIGEFSTNPETNGAIMIDPATPASFNYVGHWSVADGKIEATLKTKASVDVPAFNWVGIFHLPSEITLVHGRIEGDQLRANARYVGHPDWNDGTDVAVVFTRLNGAMQNR